MTEPAAPAIPAAARTGAPLIGLKKSLAELRRGLSRAGGRIRRMGGRTPRWLRIVAIAIVGTFAVYLIAANVILRTHLLRTWLSKDPMAMKVDYESAWSGYPGHVRVHGLSLRYQDSNVQMHIQLEHATLGIDVWALTKHTVRFSKVSAEGATYRMRHKMESVEGLEGRTSAFPPIEGFADPPLREGPPKPDVPDDQYHLWTVEVANASASIREVWIMEYRYRGEGSVAGGFHLKPKRWVWVDPSMMETHGGLYSLGDRELIRGGEARLEARVEAFDPRVPQGAEALRQMTFQLHQEGGLATLASISKTYLPRSKVALDDGTGPVTIDVHVERGIVQPDTRVTYHADRAVVKALPLVVRGDVDILAHLADAAAGADRREMIVDVVSHHAALTPAAEVRGLRASLETTSNDLSVPLELARLTGAVEAAHVPDLRAWQPVAPENTSFEGGAATIAARADYHGDALEGRIDATLDKTRFSVGTFGFVGSGKAKANVVSSDIERGIAFPDTEVDLRDIGLRLESGHEEGLWLRARFANAKLDPSAASADTDIGVASGPGDRTVKLFTRIASLPDVAADATAGTQLSASMHLRVRPRDLVLTLMGAKNGALQARGRVEKRANAAMTGAFLLSVGPFYTGLDLHDGQVGVSPLAGRDWLDQKLQNR